MPDEKIVRDVKVEIARAATEAAAEIAIGVEIVPRDVTDHASKN